MRIKYSVPITLLLALSLLLAACGSAGSSSSGSSGNSVIKAATASVNGTSETILTNMQGMTLYYFMPDTTGCASTWPPLLFTGSGTPLAPRRSPAA